VSKFLGEGRIKLVTVKDEAALEQLKEVLGKDGNSTRPSG